MDYKFTRQAAADACKVSKSAVSRAVDATRNLHAPGRAGRVPSLEPAQMQKFKEVLLELIDNAGTKDKIDLVAAGKLVTLIFFLFFF